ncbi:formin-F-like [Ptychodera flava]|uniref:formin-F-like n=1 Tax=Ptychodera flava TaxID=63121 RepID=UPI00396A09AB
MAVTEILSVLTLYSPDGRQSVMSALEFYKKERSKRHRFSIIIEELEKTQSPMYKSKLLAFVNTLICKITDTEERCQTRDEFIKLGLLDILDLLSSETNKECTGCTSQKCEACAAIQRQLGIFDSYQMLDNGEEFDEVDANVKGSTDDNGDTKTATKKSKVAIYRELYNCWFVDEIDAASSSLATEAEAGAVFSDGTIIDDIWKRIAMG